jgi:hypothetical protein
MEKTTEKTVFQYETKYAAFNCTTKFTLDESKKLEITQTWHDENGTFDQLSIEIWPGDYTNFLNGINQAYREQLLNFYDHGKN